MAGFRVKLNKPNTRALLRSPEVQRDLKRRADAIARQAGPGHEVDLEVGRNRTRAEVRTATPAARRAEATSRNLSRALDAGRS